MNELIILALALIGATVTWNISRARAAHKAIVENNGLYAQNESAAAEFGRLKEELRIWRARHAQAAGYVFKDVDGTCDGMWRLVDVYVFRATQHVMRMNFIAAVGEMREAVAVPQEYFKDRLPIAFADRDGTMHFYVGEAFAQEVRSRGGL